MSTHSRSLATKIRTLLFKYFEKLNGDEFQSQEEAAGYFLDSLVWISNSGPSLAQIGKCFLYTFDQDNPFEGYALYSTGLRVSQNNVLWSILRETRSRNAGIDPTELQGVKDWFHLSTQSLLVSLPSSRPSSHLISQTPSRGRAFTIANARLESPTTYSPDAVHDFLATATDTPRRELGLDESIELIIIPIGRMDRAGTKRNSAIFFATVEHDLDSRLLEDNLPSKKLENELRTLRLALLVFLDFGRDFQEKKARNWTRILEGTKMLTSSWIHSYGSFSRRIQQAVRTLEEIDPTPKRKVRSHLCTLKTIANDLHHIKTNLLTPVTNITHGHPAKLGNLLSRLAKDPGTFRDLQSSEVTFRIPHFAREIHLSVDEVILKAVLSDVLNNSVLAISARGQPGVIEFSFSLDEERSLCTLYVKDTGCGLAPDVRTAVFRTQGCSKWPDGVQGKGVGLYCCKGLLSLYQSGIDIYPSPDSEFSTTVELSLSLKEEHESVRT